MTALAGLVCATRLAQAARRASARQASAELVGVSCLADCADTLFARAVLDADGTLVVVVPAEKYRGDLPDSHHATSDALNGQAAEVIHLDHLESPTTAGALVLRRARWVTPPR